MLKNALRTCLAGVALLSSTVSVAQADPQLITTFLKMCSMLLRFRLLKKPSAIKSVNGMCAMIKSYNICISWQRH